MRLLTTSLGVLLPLSLIMSLSFSGTVAFAAGKAAPTPDEALSQLKEGSARYLSGVQKYPKIDPVRRLRTADEGQKPIATVLGCADARVPVETAFDKAFGEVFVIRVAGNVCQMAELASIEYGVNYLKTPLVVVLGHTQCGAVAAAVSEASLSGSLPKLMDEIRPAVQKAKQANPKLSGEQLTNEAIKQNVWKSIEDVFAGSPLMAKACKEHKVKIVGAIRDIKTGKISWLGEHPNQAKLTSAP